MRRHIGNRCDVIALKYLTRRKLTQQQQQQKLGEDFCFNCNHSPIYRIKCCNSAGIKNMS